MSYELLITLAFILYGAWRQASVSPAARVQNEKDERELMAAIKELNARDKVKKRAALDADTKAKIAAREQWFKEHPNKFFSPHRLM